MGQLFGSIYCWFENLFGIELANYLWGQSSPEQTGNSFIGIGLITIVISLIIAVLFYFIFCRREWNNFWAWLIAAGVNAVINLIIGWQWVLYDLNAGKMYKLNEAGEKIQLMVDGGNCWQFGFANLFISILFFVIISLILKWKSPDCEHAPF